jgi:hypothetical protein
MSKIQFDEKDESTWPEYISTTGKPVLIALTSGHNASVLTSPTRLHPRFHRAAVGVGAVPVSLLGSLNAEHAEPTESAQAQKKNLLVEEIGKMMSAAAEDPRQQAELFNNDGLPIASVLATRTGLAVTNSDRDAAWEAYAAKNVRGDD